MPFAKPDRMVSVCENSAMGQTPTITRRANQSEDFAFAHVPASLTTAEIALLEGRVFLSKPVPHIRNCEHACNDAIARAG